MILMAHQPVRVILYLEVSESETLIFTFLYSCLRVFFAHGYMISSIPI